MAHCLSLQFMLKLKLNVSFIPSRSILARIVSARREQTFVRFASVGCEIVKKSETKRRQKIVRSKLSNGNDTRDTLKIVQMEKFLYAEMEIKKKKLLLVLFNCALFIRRRFVFVLVAIYFLLRFSFPFSLALPPFECVCVCLLYCSGVIVSVEN